MYLLGKYAVYSVICTKITIKRWQYTVIILWAMSWDLETFYLSGHFERQISTSKKRWCKNISTVVEKALKFRRWFRRRYFNLTIFIRRRKNAEKRWKFDVEISTLIQRLINVEILTVPTWTSAVGLYCSAYTVAHN